MVRMVYLIPISLTLLVLAESSAPAQVCSSRAPVVFTESFSYNSNHGDWTFGNDFDAIEVTGGRPGAFLHNDYLQTFAPRPMTQSLEPSQFTGNFRGRKVVSIGADFKVISATVTTAERYMSVVLVHDSGTPQDVNDDIYAFYISNRLIPQPSQGWLRYQFNIPANSPVLPLPHSTTELEPGWVITQGDMFTPPADPDAAWNRLIQDVDQVVFWFHDPRMFALLQDWDVGMDNVTISTCP